MTTPVKILPMLLGPANAAAATGASWRWVRDTAALLGVRFVGAGRKRFVPAAEFLAALARDAEPSNDPAVGTPEDPAVVVRRALGLQRRFPSPKAFEEKAAGKPLLQVVDFGDCPEHGPGATAGGDR